MRINIHYKITLVFSIIIAFVLSAVYVYLNNSLKKYTYMRTRENILKEVSLSKYFLEEYNVDGLQSQQLDNIADKIGNDLGLRVTIISPEGAVLGDSQLDMQKISEVETHLYRPEIQDALKSGIGENKRFSTTIKKDMLYVASVYGKTAMQGIVRLSIPLSETEQISTRLKNMLILSLLAAFVFVIIIGFVASKLISKPIQEISNISQNIAKGDFSKRILNFTNDEIGDLSKAFNYMSEQIRLKIEEVTLSKSRFEAVILSMFEGVMVIDSSGVILLMNQTLKNCLLVKENYLGKRPIEVIRNIEIQEMADTVLKLKQGVESREISVFFEDEKKMMVHATPIIRQGIIEGAVLVFHDITEIHRLEKIRRDFVANVSHELRTPVSSIKGYAETLLEGALYDKENAEDFLKIIYSDSERLAKLIDDILDLSKIESGKLKLAIKPICLAPVVSRVVDGLNKQSADKSIEIKIDIPENIPNISADEIRLAQVLLNLIDNAIKYNNEKGSITISAKEEGRFARIDISDTGIGIPEEDLPRIFERFYRVDKAHSRELGGTGLGLSIVKHIVQSHNGEVFVKSIFGRGCTFGFTIPKA